MFFSECNGLLFTFQPKLVEDDDRLLSDIGLKFGDGSPNRFVLSDTELEENDQAECIVRIPKDMKIYQLTMGKNETAGHLYKQVLQKCQSDDLNTESFVLTFNSYKIDATAELVKVCKFVLILTRLLP